MGMTENVAQLGLSVAAHPGEAHTGGVSGRLNRLRAGVLGANDGIVSTAALVVGVAATTSGPGAILAAGAAGAVAGAVSMALGEYVSVSTQRDTERALLAAERLELEQFPERELEELTSLYEMKGLTPETARLVAQELTAKDAFAAHADAELHIDPAALSSPAQAAVASAVSFAAGAALPLVAILLPPPDVRIAVTFLAVVLALVVTGAVSARLGSAAVGRAVARLVAGGVLAMAITYALGLLVTAAF
jgi:VIT1/CCC1 family predicted Fe2+/Mn2+ transporter